MSPSRRCRIALTCMLVLALGLLAGPASAQDEEPGEESLVAQQTLRAARLAYDRGEFEKAVDSFASILDTPVKLRTREDLHEGFLYYAFTLFLQGKVDRAKAKLLFALRLEPKFAPSPVTTRPDLLAFYHGEQVAYVEASGPDMQLQDSIFPELREIAGGGRVIVRRRFVPFLGIGLRQLGHKPLGNVLLVTELSSGLTNVASWILRGAVYANRTPAGWNATFTSRGMNYASFGVFWAALLVDLVVSLALQRFYTLNPGKRRRPEPVARARPRAPPRLRVEPTGMSLTFW